MKKLLIALMLFSGSVSAFDKTVSDLRTYNLAPQLVAKKYQAMVLGYWLGSSNAGVKCISDRTNSEIADMAVLSIKYDKEDYENDMNVDMAFIKFADLNRELLCKK